MKKVLYITPSYASRILVKRIVTSEGHTFLGAETFQEGQELITQEQPDLVIISGNTPNGLYGSANIHYFNSPMDINQLTNLLRLRLHTPIVEGSVPLFTAITQTTYL